jgi:hypothetical protein
MAGHGPPPKHPTQRRRRNADAPRKRLEAELNLPAPALPEADSYSERTRRWYATWSSSPQAARFLATDWQRLAMLAPLVDRYFAEPDKSLLAEIRLNEACMGATEADRLRLRWDIAENAPASGDVPAPSDAERDAKILRLVTDD